MLPAEPSSTGPSDPSLPTQPVTPAVTPAVTPTDGLTIPPTPVTSPGPAGAGARNAIVALAAIFVFVISTAVVFASGYWVGHQAAEQPGTPVAAEGSFQPFWDTYSTIVNRYAGGDVDPGALVRGAIKGMVDSLGDPYSAYLTPDQYRQGLQDLSGQFEGIGAEIGTKNAKGETSDCTTLGPDCLLVVVSPLDGSPAEKAGLKAGDVIASVDGATVNGLTVDEARNKVRGKKGTQVILSVVRGTATPIEIPVVRDVIVQQEVITKTLGNGTVAYIAVTGFSDNAATKFHEVLQAAMKDGKKRVILDLRGDPGGYVTAARAIASEFIKSGPIFFEEDANGSQTETDATGDGVATDPSVKLVVLVDKGSASASEIVAGALKDRERGTIVGETSFGKGTVQQWIQLQDGSALKLTIAKWLTPNKQWIHHVGIVPDVAVTTPADIGPDNDPALDKAVELLTKDSAAVPAELRPAA